MAYETEVAQILEGDGIVRDLPPAIRRKELLARALFSAAKKLSEEAFAEAEAFLAATDTDTTDEAFDHVSPFIEHYYGELLGLHEDAQACRVDTNVYSSVDGTVRDFVEGQLKEGEGQA